MRFFAAENSIVPPAVLTSSPLSDVTSPDSLSRQFLEESSSSGYATRHDSSQQTKTSVNSNNVERERYIADKCVRRGPMIAFSFRVALIEAVITEILPEKLCLFVVNPFYALPSPRTQKISVGALEIYAGMFSLALSLTFFTLLRLRTNLVDH